jgi:hypothetical protein
MNLGVSYIPAHISRHIASDMQDLNTIGCNEVLFALSENNLFVLEGAWKHGAVIAKEHGLRPLAVVWGYANTFGGGRISQIMLNDTEMWVKDRQGKTIPQACFNNPKIRAHFLEIVAMLAERGFEGIFVDEPTPQDCWCDHCREKYSRIYGGDLESDFKTFRQNNLNSSNPQYSAFRRKDTTDYVQALCDGIKKDFPMLTTMACLMPQDQACWEEIAALANLDDFGTDPYWLLEASHLTLEESLRLSRECRATALRGHKRSHIWLNAWKIKRGDEKYVYSGGLELAKTGHDSFFTWSYLGGQGTNEESDDPAEVWRNVSRLYQELSGKGSG